jgi:predicted nucleic acid-binding protein
VVDASLGIKLFVVEDYSDRAHALFARLGDDPPAELYVPDLFYIECANILWKYVRRFGYAPDQARQDLLDLGNLVLHSTPTVELRGEALDLALTLGITAYDACYVALARRLDVPLVTADQKLAQAVTSPAAEVLWIGDLAIPPVPP